MNLSICSFIKTAMISFLLTFALLLCAQEGPNILRINADNSVAGLNNLSKDSQVTITSSGVLNDTYNVNDIAVGSTVTS